MRSRPTGVPVALILTDTSAWIEYDNATGSAAHRRVASLIGVPGRLAVTEPVVMELAVGARTDAREAELRRLMARHHLLSFDTDEDFDGAVQIYRACRRAGVTPRGLVDCMIAAVARRHQASILAHDADMARVAGVVGIDLDAASLRPA